MRARRMTIAAVSLTLAPMVAAPSSLGASSFQQKADRACAKAGAAVERLPKNVTVTVIEKQIQIADAMLKDLRAINPPATSAKKYDKFITETKDQVVDVKAVLSAAEQNNKSKTESELKKATAAGKASDATARALGLAACAKDYQPEGK